MATGGGKQPTFRTVRAQCAVRPVKVHEDKAKLLHCMRTACILRTQRPGYSPKNTCHLSGSK